MFRCHFNENKNEARSEIKKNYVSDSIRFLNVAVVMISCTTSSINVSLLNLMPHKMKLYQRVRLTQNWLKKERNVKGSKIDLWYKTTNKLKRTEGRDCMWKRYVGFVTSHWWLFPSHYGNIESIAFRRQFRVKKIAFIHFAAQRLCPQLIDNNDYLSFSWDESDFTTFSINIKLLTTF